MSRLLASLVVLALSLSACVGSDEDDSPTFRLSIVSNGQTSPNDPITESLLVRLDRATGHTWAEPVTATINGADAGQVTLSEGRKGESFRDEDLPASAYFKIPMAQIQRGVHVEMTEGGEHFVIDVPDFNAPRAVYVHTPLDALRADQWIEVDSGVSTDALAGGFVVDLDNGLCFTQWGTMTSATSISFRMPPQGTFEDCGTNNAPGSSRVVDMHISLDWSQTPVATCEGPALTCDPVMAPGVEKRVAATLQF
jgi:hypothetical protein